jgi:Putative transposase
MLMVDSNDAGDCYLCLRTFLLPISPAGHKPTVHGTEQVLQYLGRYVHRIALTNSRILSIDDGQVCFRYQDSQTSRWHTMTLPAQEFIRRFLQHVLPQGCHKVRYYGLWSPIHRPLLRHLQLVLAGHPPAPPAATSATESHATEAWGPPLRAGQPCPSCGQGLLVVVCLLPRLQRGPP